MIRPRACPAPAIGSYGVTPRRSSITSRESATSAAQRPASSNASTMRSVMGAGQRAMGQYGLPRRGARLAQGCPPKAPCLKNLATQSDGNDGHGKSFSINKSRLRSAPSTAMRAARSPSSSELCAATRQRKDSMSSGSEAALSRIQNLYHKRPKMPEKPNDSMLFQPASWGCQLRTGARQSMPSSSIASCAADRDTVPVAAIGQMKRPFSRRLANKHRP
jgi:hypothetical protein